MELNLFKMIKTGKEAKQALIAGIDNVANAVKTTMGAEGRTAVIRDKMGFQDLITKDGYTVARSIESDDLFEELGGRMIKSVSEKTVNEVGDGTTTATVIAQYLVNEGIQFLEAGYSHVQFREGMQDALEDVLECIQDLKSEVGQEEIRQIGTISGNNDPEIGEIASQVFARIGDIGSVEIRDGYDKTTEVTFIDGMTFERGWSLPQFINEPKTSSVILDKVSILIFDGKILAIKDIGEQISKSLGENKSLLILAEDVDQQVMSTLVKHRLETNLKINVCMLPDFGQNRANILEDLAIFTGAKVHNPLYNNGEIVMGFAERIISDKDQTTVIVGDSNSEPVKQRIQVLEEQIELTTDLIDKSKIEKRLANLRNALAVVHVGGTNEYDMAERKDRIDDAIKAVKSSLKGGFVSGGGSTLLYINLFEIDVKNTNNDSYNAGYNLVRNSLLIPFRQILENAGMDASKYTDKIKEYGDGVNVRTRKVENLLKTGVIDSARVVESALQNAVNVATTVLQTDVLITGNGL